jgi:hypothetical protein
MEDVMADNKDKAQNGKQQGQEAHDQSGTSRESGFVPSSPEANVFPAGAAQSGHGSAGGKPGGSAAPSAAGTPDEGRLGGAGGTSASGTTGNDPDR